MAQSWDIPDSASNSCMKCNKKFDFINRKHHCRACGLLFCGNCSSKKIAILNNKSKNPERVCDHCYNVESKRNIWIQRKGSLQIGDIMVHVSKFTSSTRVVRLNKSESFIELLDEKSQKCKNQIDMSSVTGVSNGKITPNLRKSKASGNNCFAIVARQTYEFECSSKKVKDNWCAAIKAYLAFTSEEDPAEMKRKAKQKYLEHMVDKKKAKQFSDNQKKRDDMRKKWGLK